jgi:hypothetical protein
MLTAHYNAIAAVKAKLPDGSTSTLSSDMGFKKQEKAWREYQVKWVARHKRMVDSPRIAPENDNADVFALNPQLMTPKTEKLATLSCKLIPENEVAGAQSTSFAELYEKKCKDYNSCNFAKMSSENLGNYLHLVRMEIQYLLVVMWNGNATHLHLHLQVQLVRGKPVQPRLRNPKQLQPRLKSRMRNQLHRFQLSLLLQPPRQ